MKAISAFCFLIISVGLLSFYPVAQHSQSDTIVCWNDSRPLKWGDFQGRADSTQEVTAQTATDIQTSVYVDYGMPNFRVTNIFDKTKSWTTDTTSVLLLKHEQLHFDISELCARRIRKGIEEMRAKKVEEIDLYNDLIRAKLEEMNRMNHEYDRKTFNGSIDFRQEEWNKKIKCELDLLRNYATKADDCKSRGIRR